MENTAVFLVPQAELLSFLPGPAKYLDPGYLTFHSWTPADQSG